ncbi:MAG: hypothetical protein M1569_01180 [Candidatus Marsarchaeota archaeon]|nr:hypothetical protein [Candidatus Marsarchaeota archaeon]MCL5413001.1 hypothetical protein [Candidatus Marsarchaeota archaeon]
MLGFVLSGVVNGCVTNSGILNTLSGFLCAGPNIWFPIVMLGVLIVISVAGIIFAIAPLLGRNDIRVWARAKMFDGAVSIIFALIFISFSATLYHTPLAHMYYNAGLLPPSCTPASVYSFSGTTPQGADQQQFIDLSPSPSNGGTLYGIAACDIYSYNQLVAQFVQSVFYFSLIANAAPTTTIAPESDLGFTFTITWVPIVVVFQYMVPLMGALFALVMASDMLQILIGVSMLLFSVFMVVGLIARSFGITRSFGGAMIAFGLGIGFIYPLLISVSYGFLVNAIEYRPSITGGILPSIGAIISPIYRALFGGSGLSLTALINSFEPILNPLFIWGGMVAVGLTVLPLLNLVIVDAFIIDFSRAVGERMDLLSILTRIV